MKHLLFLLLPLASLGQTKMEATTYTLSNGWTVNKGDSIRISKGSKPDGDFDFIYKGSDDLNSKHAGASATVERIYKIKDGYGSVKECYLQVSGEGFQKYRVDIEDAVYSQEVKCPSGFPLKRPASNWPTKKEFKKEMIPLSEGKIFYSQVVQTDSVGTKQLQQACKKALVRAFNSAKAVIQSESDATIIGKGLNTIYYDGPLGIPLDINESFVIEVNIKDNRYKIDLYDISLEYYDKGLQTQSVDFYYTGRAGKNVSRNFLHSMHVDNLKFFETYKNFVTAELSKDNSW